MYNFLSFLVLCVVVIVAMALAEAWKEYRNFIDEYDTSNILQTRNIGPLGFAMLLVQHFRKSAEQTVQPPNPEPENKEVTNDEQTKKMEDDKTAQPIDGYDVQEKVNAKRRQCAIDDLSYDTRAKAITISETQYLLGLNVLQVAAIEGCLDDIEELRKLKHIWDMVAPLAAVIHSKENNLLHIFKDGNVTWNRVIGAIAMMNNEFLTLYISLMNHDLVKNEFKHQSSSTSFSEDEKVNIGLLMNACTQLYVEKRELANLLTNFSPIGIDEQLINYEFEQLHSFKATKLTYLISQLAKIKEKEANVLRAFFQIHQYAFSGPKEDEKPKVFKPDVNEDSTSTLSAKTRPINTFYRVMASVPNVKQIIQELVASNIPKKSLKRTYDDADIKEMDAIMSEIHHHDD